MKIDEQLLQFIWKLQKFDSSNLVTNKKEQVTIISPGFQNFDSGPDFQEARIQIGEIEWFGNIEIHINSSDWIKHKHHLDKAYNNTILHVVWNNDTEIIIEKEPVPTIALQKLVNNSLLNTYKQLLTSESEIPCSSQLHQINQITISNMVEKCSVERLENKSISIQEILSKNNNDWQETLFLITAKNFGFKLNAEAFTQLAKRLPFGLLKKYTHSLIKLEALLFGAAGFLGDPKDDYQSQLYHEFVFLSKKHNIIPLAEHIWKFSKTRPANFPTIRLAQIAFILHHNFIDFQEIIQIKSSSSFIKSFTISTSTYWVNHFHFGKERKRPSKHVSKSTKENIIINTICTILSSYSKYTGEIAYNELAMKLLQQLSIENNRITRKWREVGIVPQNALESQGLIQLYANYCSRKKCLHCSIGSTLVLK